MLSLTSRCDCHKRNERAEEMRLFRLRELLREFLVVPSGILNVGFGLVEKTRRPTRS